MVFRGVASIRVFLKFRGKRLVTCPETHKPAAVEVAAGKAAKQALVGTVDLRLSDCSRWPEREACGQECLEQIVAAPEDCLVRTIVSNWYRGQTCLYCGKPFGEINWLEHPPALVASDLKTVEWKDVPAEKLPELFSTHWPVCWNCHIAQTFRREHPDLVVDRPWKH